MELRRRSGASRIEHVRSLAVDILITIRGSFIYFIWTCGLLMLLAGLFLQDGVVAGLLVIFGVSSFIYGVLGYFGLKLIGYS